MWSKPTAGDHRAMSSFPHMVKRVFDVGFTSIAILLLLPLACLAAVLIRLDSTGPVLYRSIRIGKSGRRFVLYKFRSMVQRNGNQGASITHRNDPRVTRIGRILRRTKFDEFPQVINVLRGDMSIVGPRPECEEYVAVYSAKEREVLRMRPGLTSLAQVLYREEESMLPDREAEAYYVKELLPRKLALDMYLVRHWTLALDFKVLILGVLALFKLPIVSALWPRIDQGVFRAPGQPE
jgi:lipopolysaccharide/colanic/teichoic acid biosynthesis glycosyltransferase